MARTYSNETVFLSYHLEAPSDYAPDDGDLDAWDADLASKYEAKLDATMTAAGIPLTSKNRSLIVLLAQMSNGQSGGVQLNNACKYFKNVWP
jgi:hypothetical protein